MAGKYRSGYGTPFDLADLPDAPGFDRNAVPFIRLIDIVGDGTVTDSSGDIVYDPYPTLGSAGFDLDAIGALHLAEEPPIRITRFLVTESGYELEWTGVAWTDYAIEGSSDLGTWTELVIHRGVAGTNTAGFAHPGTDLSFFRVRSVPPGGILDPH